MFRWDLTGLALAPGDRVVYRMESGTTTPSPGKSGILKNFSLVVREERDRAAKEVEEAQQLSDGAPRSFGRSVRREKGSRGPFETDDQDPGTGR